MAPEYVTRRDEAVDISTQLHRGDLPGRRVRLGIAQVGGTEAKPHQDAQRIGVRREKTVASSQQEDLLSGRLTNSRKAAERTLGLGYREFKDRAEISLEFVYSNLCCPAELLCGVLWQDTEPSDISKLLRRRPDDVLGSSPNGLPELAHSLGAALVVREVCDVLPENELEGVRGVWLRWVVMKRQQPLDDI